MSIIDVLEDALRGLCLSRQEFYALTELTKHNWDNWVRNPDTKLQHKTLRKIRKGLNIEFLKDPDTGEISGWRRAGEPAVGEYAGGTNSGLVASPQKSFSGEKFDVGKTDKSGLYSGVQDLYIASLLQLEREAAKRLDDLKQSEEWRAMHTNTKSRLETHHKTLMLQLRRSITRAEAEMKDRILEFEQIVQTVQLEEELDDQRLRKSG